MNVVQKFIRSGHQETVDKCLRWIDEDGSAARGDSFCDAGCGVGTLAIPLAQRGAKVRASDISEAMAMEGKQRAASMELEGSVTFETADLETLDGKYDTTTCIDVSISAASLLVHALPAVRGTVELILSPSARAVMSIRAAVSPGMRGQKVATRQRR